MSNKVQMIICIRNVLINLISEIDKDYQGTLSACNHGQMCRGIKNQVKMNLVRHFYT